MVKMGAGILIVALIGTFILVFGVALQSGYINNLVVLRDGSNDLTANWDAGAFAITADQFNLFNNEQIQFRDAQIYIRSDNDGDLDLYADNFIDLHTNASIITSYPYLDFINTDADPSNSSFRIGSYLDASISVGFFDEVSANRNFVRTLLRFHYGATPPYRLAVIDGGIESAGNVDPSSANNYALGNINREWQDMYLGSGKLYLGIDQDTNLYRGAVNQLKTDDQFAIAYGAGWNSLVFDNDIPDTRIMKVQEAGINNYLWIDSYADSGKNAYIGLFRGNVEGNALFSILKADGSANYAFQFDPQLFREYIRDSGIYVSSEDDGHLDLTADIAIDLNTPNIYPQSGSVIDFVDETGDKIKLYADLYKIAVSSADLDLFTDANIRFSSDEVADVFGFMLNTYEMRIRDAQIYVASLDDGHLDLTADVAVDINTPLIATSAQLNIDRGANQHFIVFNRGADGWADIVWNDEGAGNWALSFENAGTGDRLAFYDTINAEYALWIEHGSPPSLTVPFDSHLQFRDAQVYISSLDDGHLDLEADISIDLNAPSSLDGDMNYNHNYMLGMDLDEHIHHDSVAGIGVQVIDQISAGYLTQDRHIHSMHIFAEPAPGGGKWLNVTLSDGINDIEVAITGADQEGFSDTGSFDWDVSAETFTVSYEQTAGGATDEFCVHYDWHYKENE